MSYKPGDIFYDVFNTANISGIATNLDLVPSGNLIHNGVFDNNVVVFCNQIDTARYGVSGIIPSTYLAGDVCHVGVHGLLNNNLVKGTSLLGVLDSERLADLTLTGTDVKEMRYKLGIDGTVVVPTGTQLSRIELSNSGLNQVNMETGVNLHQALQVAFAVLNGVSSGAGNWIWYNAMNNPTISRLSAFAISGIRSTVNYNWNP